MSASYQSLTGLFDLLADTLKVEDLTVTNQLTLPRGARNGYILTSDSRGRASWKPDPNVLLAGDAVGPLLNNRIDTLAGGTVLVENLVEKEKEATLTNKVLDSATNNVAANALRGLDWKKEIVGMATSGQLTVVDDHLEFLKLDVLAEKLIGFVATSGEVTADDTLLTSIGKLAGNGTALRSDLDAAEADIVELYGRASALQTGINQVNVVVTGHTTSITNLESEVDALQEAIGTTGTAEAIANTGMKRDGSASTAVKDLKVSRLLSDLNFDVILNMPSTSVFLGRGIAASVGNDITCIGYGAGTKLGSSAFYNTAVGSQALNACISGTNSTAIGYGALSSSTGSSNTAVGSEALGLTTTGGSNTAMGLAAAQQNTTGSSNIAIGREALRNSTTASNCTAIGYRALFNSNGAGNTALGFQAGYNNRSGNVSNTFIGNGADANSNALVISNSTAIGNGAKCTASNQVVIGNSSVTSTTLNGTVSAGALSVAGEINAQGNVRTQTVMAKGNVNPTQEGAWVSWNRTNAMGETVFANARGGGVGRWDWMTFGPSLAYESTAMTLSPTGNLSAAGIIQGKPTYCRQGIKFTWRQQIIPGEDRVQFDAYDVGNGWVADQNGQFVYTAPVAGTYRYSFFMRLNSTAPNTMTHLVVVPDPQHYETVVEYSIESLFCTGTGYVNVNAGDEIYLLCWCTRQPVILPPPNDTVKFGCTVSNGILSLH